VGNAIEVEHVKILRYRPLTGDLILEAGTGWREGVVGSATFPIALSSPPARAYQTGQPVVIPDIRIAKDYQASPILLDHGIVSLLNVPLQIDGAALAFSVRPCSAHSAARSVAARNSRVRAP
jgi:two-component system, sensor histidine kinase PdtaS